MKKLFYLMFVVISITSCKEDIKPTSYYIVNSSTPGESSIEYLDGTLWEITVFCYDGVGDVVREDNIDSVSSGGGISPKIEVTGNIVKLVVSFKFLPQESPYYDMDFNVRRYTVTRFPITPETENRIEINDNTTVGKTLSVSSNQQLLKDAKIILPRE